MGLLFNIAIDGHSSCGKSTIAKSIASNYGMRYIDTGAMYRAITLFCMRHSIIENKKVNLEVLNSSIDAIEIDFRFNVDTKKSETILNGENVEQIIRGVEVSDHVSIVAQIQSVREKLIILQQEIGKSGNVVMDGRDIGTIVFPDAKLKLFVTASAAIRTQRRYDELVVKGDSVTYKEIFDNLTLRDLHDTNRAINPLVKAEDAVLIDNSKLSIEEQDNLINDLILDIK